MQTFSGLRLPRPVSAAHGGDPWHDLADGRDHAGGAGPDPAGRQGPDGLLFVRPQRGGRRRGLIIIPLEVTCILPGLVSFNRLVTCNLRDIFVIY